MNIENSLAVSDEKGKGEAVLSYFRQGEAKRFFKKVNLFILGNHKAQTAIEYFLLFSVIAAITFLGASTFYDRTRKMSNAFFIKAAKGIMGEKVKKSDIAR